MHPVVVEPVTVALNSTEPSVSVDLSAGVGTDAAVGAVLSTSIPVFISSDVFVAL